MNGSSRTGRLCLLREIPENIFHGCSFRPGQDVKTARGKRDPGRSSIAQSFGLWGGSEMAFCLLKTSYMSCYSDEMVERSGVVLLWAWGSAYSGGQTEVRQVKWRNRDGGKLQYWKGSRSDRNWKCVSQMPVGSVVLLSFFFFQAVVNP